MFPLVFLAIGMAPTDAADAALARAARFYDGSEAYPGLDEDLQAWHEGARQLRELAVACTQEEWPGVRAKLVGRLNDPNRGVWYASLSAVVAREGEGAGELLDQQIRQSSDPGRVELATRILARVGRGASEEFRARAVGRLQDRLATQSDASLRRGFVVALGCMGPPATDALLGLRRQEPHGRLAAPEFAYALSMTGDARSLRPLSTIRDQATGHERIAASLALGTLLGSTGVAAADGIEAADSLRRDLLEHQSPEVAAAGGLALARARLLHGDSAATSRVFALLAEPAALQSALRSIFEARLPLDEAARSRIAALAAEGNPEPISRKIAQAILLTSGAQDAELP
jgi:hypothetical protein